MGWYAFVKSYCRMNRISSRRLTRFGSSSRPRVLQKRAKKEVAWRTYPVGANQTLGEARIELPSLLNDPRWISLPVEIASVLSYAYSNFSKFQLSIFFV